jgi:hypothetical protein
MDKKILNFQDFMKKRINEEGKKGSKKPKEQEENYDTLGLPGTITVLGNESDKENKIALDQLLTYMWFQINEMHDIIKNNAK